MKKKFSIFSFLLVFSIWAAAQAPGHVPYGKPEPVVFTPLNIVLLIVLPILMAFVYFYYKKNKRKNDTKK